MSRYSDKFSLQCKPIAALTSTGNSHHCTHLLLQGSQSLHLEHPKRFNAVMLQLLQPNNSKNLCDTTCLFLSLLVAASPQVCSVSTSWNWRDNTSTVKQFKRVQCMKMKVKLSLEKTLYGRIEGLRCLPVSFPLCGSKPASVQRVHQQELVSRYQPL